MRRKLYSRCRRMRSARCCAASSTVRAPCLTPRHRSLPSRTITKSGIVATAGAVGTNGRFTTLSQQRIGVPIALKEGCAGFDFASQIALPTPLQQYPLSIGHFPLSSVVFKRGNTGLTRQEAQFAHVALDI